MYKFFYFRVYSREDAEDLTSETFIAFAGDKKILESKEVDPVKYLFGIAKHTFFHYLKKKYKHKVDVAFDELISTETSEFLENFEQVEKTFDPEAEIKKLIPRLPSSQRKIAEMRFNQRLSALEISKEIKKSLRYVKTTQNRAINSLRKLAATTTYRVPLATKKPEGQ